MRARLGLVSGTRVHWRRPPRFRTPLDTPLVILILLTMSLTEGAQGIDCFKCVSVNGDNPSCEDPFHNNYTVGMLESPCLAGRKGREGLFPATACIKLAGIYDDNGQTLIIRDCTVDSGSLTLDTELARMSHCGAFVLSGRYVKGCLQSCDDYEGCNGAPPATRSSTTSIGSALFLLLYFYKIL
ncbi:uncharacterized protein LOC121858642 isoform X2 [Homarus americanus]|uniref:uncharacterized protein LOC121858642 isoform X2 n=2 Tax=Homarus americanus TaxID=6706 RepID=UPI001C44B6A6|nr:uncharacterized protein LOC121858642 isoform X2 [Homarus americanus]